MKEISTLAVRNAASFWYPTMLTEERGEISESKAAELLGLNLIEYREAKESAISAVLNLVNTLPSPLCSLLDALTEKPELFLCSRFSELSSSGKENKRD